MPKQIVRLTMCGNQDRRSMTTQGDMDSVLIRENWQVVGSEKGKQFNKKLPGADRFNATSIGAYDFTSGIRYYTKQNVRRTFAYATDGYLYYFDDNGNTTQLIGVFSPLAVPCFENIRVSDNDILYFSEGISTGLYSFDGNLSNQFIKETAVTLNFVDMVSWLDRLWGVEEDEEAINYSKNLVPTNFTDSTDAGTIIVGAKRGSKIMRLIVLNDVLYIFKQDSIWRVIGRTPSEFQLEIVHDSFGLAARWSLQKVENGVIFMGSDYEMYSFGGTKESLKLLTYNIALSGDLTKDLSPIINVNKLENIRSTYHNKLYRMAFVESGKVTNNLEYIYNAINETDSFSRDFNISCYIPFDRTPDNRELFVGRVGDGRLMRMYKGKNCDNQASSPSMPIKLQSKFVGSGSPRNMRVNKIWGNFGVLGSRDLTVGMLIDSRNSTSDIISDDMKTVGETTTIIGTFVTNNQDAITSRMIPKRAKSKCQNFSIFISENRQDRDVEFSSFDIEVITKQQLKRSQIVGV